MKLTCMVVDDEPLAADLLESYVRKTPFLEFNGKYPNALLAMEEENFGKTDLLFLDIQMPELNGLEFSRMVNPQTRIVFTTAFEQYAVDSYKVDALDYLLKPISYPDFLRAAEKALRWYEKSGENREQEERECIFVKADHKLLRIDLRKIQYIEGLKDYVKIYMEGQSLPVVSLMSMKSVEELLPMKDFMRVHRSYIVRADQIRVVERNRIVFGKNYIPVAESCKTRFMAFLNERGVK